MTQPDCTLTHPCLGAVLVGSRRLRVNTDASDWDYMGRMDACDHGLIHAQMVSPKECVVFVRARRHTMGNTLKIDCATHNVALMYVPVDVFMDINHAYALAEIDVEYQLQGLTLPARAALLWMMGASHRAHKELFYASYGVPLTNSLIGEKTEELTLFTNLERSNN
jgi:hypothetical protein